MNRLPANRTRRIATAVGTVLAAGAIGVFAIPTADAAPAPAPVTEPATDAVPAAMTASEWACFALGGVDVGLCLDNPIPDTSGLPTVPEILEDTLGLL